MRAMLVALIACLCSYSGESRTYVYDSVDIIELNEYRIGTNSNSAHQLIFWEWKPRVPSYNKKTGLTTYVGGGYVVRDWLRWNGGGPVPRYDHKLKQYSIIVYDARVKNYRCVVAPMYRRTKTDYDPEVYNQRQFSPYLRRKLSTK